ncbi:ATP-binding cassette domain-containing protein [Alginatibacterium sediminis]|uniref:ATP-binding cassette domain-containing protein n=1 Tax=Alginatibacterium sediminis TaxID=2164068 RepID=A0A420E8Y2_9ALTE|nr:ATP-binding cassette domain-containing protein [Alginatibacterium sediminis]RKF15793.1 ATP-binding cassette domain-containing protein [Alginatibacterium sediminis]
MFEIRAFSVAFDSKPLFEPITIKVKAGEIKTLMGASGSGKSTLLAAIAGTLSHKLDLQGEIVLDGKNICVLPQAMREVGILFQDDLLFPHMNVYQNLRFGLNAQQHIDPDQEISDALERAGLAGFEQRDIATLSGGQRARISLLRSLLARPKMLLMDEPFSKLDTQLRQQFRDFVAEQIQALNIPALLVTHDIEDCMQGEPIQLVSYRDFPKDTLE